MPPPTSNATALRGRRLRAASVNLSTGVVNSRALGVHPFGLGVEGVPFHFVGAARHSTGDLIPDPVRLLAKLTLQTFRRVGREDAQLASNSRYEPNRQSRSNERSRQESEHEAVIVAW